MASTAEQLFATFAARAAEILRERFRMDASTLLRVSARAWTVEGLVRSAQEGGPEWFRYTTTAERLQSRGPDAAASEFVREYLGARGANR